MPRLELIRRPEPQALRTFPSGSTLLDQVNGGGWMLNRVINVVGDKSTNKTGLAIEACANFARLYGAENIRYNEPEFAFDPTYASILGMPKGVSFVGNELYGGSPTVEHWADDLSEWLASRKPSDPPSLYITDSLDAMTDEGEQENAEWAKGWNTRKARVISEFFRNNISLLAQRHCTLFIVSQIRENIGVTFGEKYARSGGHALDFYSSQIDWLSHSGRIERGKQIVGIKILVQNKKNKAGPPFQKAELQLYFNYGVDDELSMLDWLKDGKSDALMGLKYADSVASYKKLLERAREMRDRDLLSKYNDDLKSAVIKGWAEIQDALKPMVQKYE